MTQATECHLAILALSICLSCKFWNLSDKKSITLLENLCKCLITFTTKMWASFLGWINLILSCCFKLFHQRMATSPSDTQIPMPDTRYQLPRYQCQIHCDFFHSSKKLVQGREKEGFTPRQTVQGITSNITLLPSLLPPLSVCVCLLSFPLFPSLCPLCQLVFI